MLYNMEDGESQTVQLNVRLPPALIKEMDKWVDAGVYSNKADFIKEAIREKLNTLVKEKNYSISRTEIK
jgi:Arc/MetJ-type ribon-helix-helix transcriptional regulator